MPYRPTDATRATAAAKRVAVLRAARALVAEQGFTGTTVAAIAARSGVAVGSVYSHFDKREALLAEVFRDAASYELAQVKSAVDGQADPARRLDALIEVFAERALRGRQLAWALLFEPVIPAVETERMALRQSYRDLGTEIIAAGVASGDFDQQDAPVVSSAIMGAISEALVGALNPSAATSEPTDDAALLNTIRTFCFRALGAEKRR